MRSLSDKMAASERTLDDEELVEYILIGLDQEYDPIVSAIITRTTSVSLSELYAQLLAFEKRPTLMRAKELIASSANVASHGRGHSGREGFGHDNGRDSFRTLAIMVAFNFRSNRGGFNSSSDKRPMCQVCNKKKGHTGDRCWHMFDEDYAPEEKTVVAAT
jgi:hypothetical protein